MLVLVAHNGKTLELEVQPSTGVDALQTAVAGLTRIGGGDQILMCEGAPLDPSKPLSAYKLPVDEAGNARDVFLYSRSLMVAGPQGLDAETLPAIRVDEDVAGSIQYEAHLLEGAPSPLVRALPAYERDFRAHLLRARALADASQRRLRDAEQLLSELHVQGIAIDAARSNVDHHYVYICEAYKAFMRVHAAQASAHREILSRFAADMERLAGCELHPAARGAGQRRLLDLLPEQRLRDWADSCDRSHAAFVDKVAELEALFEGLRADVDALFMQAPSVDQGALCVRCEEMHTHVNEQNSIVQALESDFDKVQQLVEEAVRQLSARPGASSVAPLDACGIMEVMNESHVSQLLPRCTEGDAVLERFRQNCLDSKNQMAGEVLEQLRRISGQQSKIRKMREKLALFRQVAAKQAEAFAELLLVRRVPAAYRQCLAECMRRKAFADLYAGRAGELAEQMGRLREKEAAKRDRFKAAVERYIPGPVLAGMGLLAPPPHCQVTVPPPEAGLLQVTMEDLRRVPADAQAVTLPAPVFSRAHSSPRKSSELDRGASGSRPAVSKDVADKEAEEEEDAPAEAEGASLALENARLRAELAAHIALEAAREVAGPAVSEAQRSRPGSPVARSAAGASPRAAAVPAASPERRRHLATTSAPAGLSAIAAASPGRQGSCGEPPPPPVAPDPGASFRAALAAKDDLVLQLERELSSARQQVVSYEDRIRRLESRLTRASLQLSTSSASSSRGGGAASGAVPARRAGSLPPSSPVLTGAERTASGQLPPPLSLSGSTLEEAVAAGGLSPSLSPHHAGTAGVSPRGAASPQLLSPRGAASAQHASSGVSTVVLATSPGSAASSHTEASPSGSFLAAPQQAGVSTSASTPGADVSRMVASVPEGAPEGHGVDLTQLPSDESQQPAPVVQSGCIRVDAAPSVLRTDPAAHPVIPGGAASSSAAGQTQLSLAQQDVEDSPARPPAAAGEDAGTRSAAVQPASTVASGSLASARSDVASEAPVDSPPPATGFPPRESVLSATDLVEHGAVAEAQAAQAAAAPEADAAGEVQQGSAAGDEAAAAVAPDAASAEGDDMMDACSEGSACSAVSI